MISKISIIFILLISTLFASEKEYSFGVVSQRNAVLTAKIWNPILAYVENKTGIKLVLSTARTGDDSKQATDKGEYDFVYSNHFFENQPLIYTPILKPNNEYITGQIVVLNNSSIKNIKELQNETIGFPSKSAFIAYAVTTDYLKKQRIHYKEVFGGNQEGIMAQLKSGSIKAISVNSLVLKDYAAKENLEYKVLWESEKYTDIPIAVNNRVSLEVAKKVQDALANMHKDEQGTKILEESAQIMKQKSGFSFSKATIHDYQSYINFYKQRQK